MHNFYREHYSASHDYPEFIPHITIATDYQNEALHLDLFHRLVDTLQFDTMKVLPLDTDL